MEKRSRTPRPFANFRTATTVRQLLECSNRLALWQPRASEFHYVSGLEEMARALRLQFEDAIYHLCARGNRRQGIFADDKDCARFLALLGQSLGRFKADLLAFVLLSNHFHFLARTRKANLSRWMHSPNWR